MKSFHVKSTHSQTKFIIETAKSGMNQQI